MNAALLALGQLAPAIDSAQRIGSAAYTGNGGTVAGVAVGIPATGFGAIGATSRRFYAVRCTYDGSVGLFHNNDPAPTVASPFSTPTGTANPATGELWLSLLRRQDGAYVPRWGQGTLVGGEHLPPASDAWNVGAPCTPSGGVIPAALTDTVDAGNASAAETLPDAVGAFVYQYTSATAVSASIAQLTMRKLAP